MSIELRRQPKQSLSLANSAWSFLLNLGEAYGWTPAGTTLPGGRKKAKTWDGGYVSNDGQRVGGDDASAFASALLCAAKDRGYGRKAKSVSAEMNKGIRDMAVKEIGEDIDP